MVEATGRLGNRESFQPLTQCSVLPNSSSLSCTDFGGLSEAVTLQAAGGAGCKGAGFPGQGMDAGLAQRLGLCSWRDWEAQVPALKDDPGRLCFHPLCSQHCFPSRPPLPPSPFLGPCLSEGVWG